MSKKTILQQIIDSEPPTPDDTPYYADLGRFVAAYAVAEMAVHKVARRLLGISDQKARVLFAGARIGDVISRVKAIVPLSRIGKKDVATIASCLDQLDVIGKKRHSLVHRFVTLEEDKFHVTNFFTAKSTRTAESDVISKVELEEMYYDCWLIYVRLDRVRNPSRKKTDHAEMKAWLRSAWLYKSPQQETRKMSRQKAATLARLLRRPASSQK